MKSPAITAAARRQHRLKLKAKRKRSACLNRKDGRSDSTRIPTAPSTPKTATFLTMGIGNMPRKITPELAERLRDPNGIVKVGEPDIRTCGGIPYEYWPED